MAFRAAFYKKRRPGLAMIYSVAVQLWTRSPYSHCELIFSDGTSASSSFIDRGVRFKNIDYDSDHWDFIDLPDDLEQDARNWFVRHEHLPYDILGNITFIISPVNGSKNKWFCSEACLASLGVENPGRFSPGQAHAILTEVSKTWRRYVK